MSDHDNTPQHPDDVSPATAAEYLRMVLPLMTKHEVPATPENYAVWYSHVSGANNELSAEIERLTSSNTAFSRDICRRLHRRYVLDRDTKNIEHVRTSLGQLLTDVGSSLHGAGNDADAYVGTLDGAVVHLSTADDLHDIRNLLTTLISETRSIKTATSGLHADFEAKSKEIEELQEQLQHERRRAITDQLTGLYNRAALMDRLDHAITAMEEGKPPSVIMLDIDHFKSINDKHGHLIGDRVIRFVAQVLTKNVKGQDTAARYGGEEFTLLLPNTGVRGAQAVAESVRGAVAKAQLVRADTKQSLGQITLSAGVATMHPGEDMMELINRADQALYLAKRDGRNRVKTAN
jgi:diguanylate cyclase